MRIHQVTTAAFVPLLSLLLATGLSQARTLAHRGLSAGGEFGDPSGVTVRLPIGETRAVDVGFGPDYFGSPRLQLDYVWQLHMFGSQRIEEYFGPGLAVAFAKGINSLYVREPKKESFATQEDNRFDIGARAVFGVNFNPKSFPFEFFVETGPLLPLGRIFDLDFDGAVGVRYKL